MISNSTLLSKKKFIKTAQMISLTSVDLTPGEADKFIDYVVDESFWMKGNVRVIKMNKPEQLIRYIDFTSGTRFLKPASTFSSSDYLKTLTSDKITLASKKVRGCVVIYDDDLEDNIEGPAFASHLMKMVATKVANEIDEIFWVAVKSSGTDFSSTDARVLWDGWRHSLFNDTVLSSGINLLDASNNISGHGTDFTDTGNIAVRNTTSGVWEIKFAKMIATLPSKYKAAGLGNLRFFCNDVVENDYLEAIAARSTALGDAALLGDAPVRYNKVPIVSVPQMPTTYTQSGNSDRGLEAYGSGSYTEVVLTHKENFLVGMQRMLKMETKRAPEDEATYIFYSMRFDLAIQNPAAAVMLVNLTTG